MNLSLWSYWQLSKATKIAPTVQTIAEGCFNELLQLHALVTCLVHSRHPFTSRLHNSRSQSNAYFLKQWGNRNYSKWSNGWLNVVQRRATFVDVFRGTLEWPLWTASRTLVPSFTKLRHCQVKLATSRQLCAKWGHVERVRLRSISWVEPPFT